jgi:hypothetical protein
MQPYNDKPLNKGAVMVVVAAVRPRAWYSEAGVYYHHVEFSYSPPWPSLLPWLRNPGIESLIRNAI